MLWIDPEADPPTNSFTRPDVFTPRRIPGKIAFGKLTDTYISGGVSQGLDDDASDDADLADFTSVTIVFSPAGEVVKQVANQPISFDPSDGLFGGDSARKVWDHAIANYEPGVSAITLFNYAELRVLVGVDAAETEAKRAEYLNEYGQFLPINVYTGKLFERP